jgi:hypothetical protein
MTDTPRTDAVITYARTLERELAETKRLLAEAEKDAERYRWLRSYRGNFSPINEVYMYGGNEELDREIDSGIKNGITRAAEGKLVEHCGF